MGFFTTLTTASDWDISGALTTLTSIVTACLDWIKNNPILTVMFVAGLIPAGFMVIRKARKASKS